MLIILAVYYLTTESVQALHNISALLRFSEANIKNIRSNFRICLLLYCKLYLVHALLYIIYVVILVFVAPCAFVPVPPQY